MDTRIPRVDVVVVGAGLSGTVTAEAMHASGRRVVVLEARRRVGGRCYSVALGPSGVGVDLGAAWHWAEHTRVAALADRFGIRRVRQREPMSIPERDAGATGGGLAVFDSGDDAPVSRDVWPETPPPSWRFEGGAQCLAAALADRLPASAVRLGHRVRRIERTAQGVRVDADTTDGHSVVNAERVVLALPPRLAVATLRFAPALPDALVHVMTETPTWMSHSGKAAVTYSEPFWHAQGLSGRVRSEVGPVQDWHDATTLDGRAALVGFVDPSRLAPLHSAADATSALHGAIVRQLVRCFGPDADTPTGLAVHAWPHDAFTTPDDGSRSDPEHPPQPVPCLTDPLWNGRLVLASAETASEHPGFLDGAVEAGRRAAAA